MNARGMDRLVVLLGGGGFIGRHLSEFLLSQNKNMKIRVVSRSAQFERPVLESQRIEYFQRDLRHRAAMREVLEGADQVVYLVSNTVPESSVRDPLMDLTSNLHVLINYIGVIREMEIRDTVFISSGGTIYGSSLSDRISESEEPRPLSPYGVSKLASEHYLRMLIEAEHLELSITSLRLSNPYGNRPNMISEQGVISAFYRFILDSRPVEIWGDGSQVRDFVYIDDVSRAIDLSLSNPELGWRVINIGSGFGYSINELLMRMEVVLGRRIEKRYISDGGGHRVSRNVLDIEKARMLLGWKPLVNLDDGLGQLWEWYCREFPSYRRSFEISE